MTEQKAKQEAQKIVEKHKKIDYSDLRYSGAKQHALLEVKSNIDLLERIQSQYKNVIDLVCSVELNNLKQIKEQIELL